MKNVIEWVFKLLAAGFDSIPVLSKFKGYRSVFGFIGLAVVAALRYNQIGSDELLGALEAGFLVFSALALNAKDNS